MRTVVATAMETDQGSGFLDFLCSMARGRRGGYWLSEERAGIQQNTLKHTRICGDHFMSGERKHVACGTEITRQYCCSGKPVEEPESVDYVPSIFSYNQHRRDNEARRREQRRSRADRRRQILEIAEAEKENEMLAEQREKESHMRQLWKLLQQLSRVDIQTQTSPPVEDIDSLPSPVYPTTPTLLNVPVESAVLRPFGSKLLEGDDERTKFYTGLTSWSIFKHLVKFLSARCPSLLSVHARLSPFNSILLTLMRLRLNLLMEDIAYRFNIGPSTASEIFSRNIELMYANLKFLIKMAITRGMSCKYATSVQGSLSTHPVYHRLL